MIDVDNDDPDYYEYVTSGAELRYFKKVTEGFIKKFEKLGLPRIHINQTGHQSSASAVTLKDYRRLDIIEAYLKTAVNFFDLTYYPKGDGIKRHCIICGLSIDHTPSDGLWICECGYETQMYETTSSTHKSESEYRSEVTFLKEITYFQGKENMPLPSGLFDDLDDYFATLGIMRQEVLTRPLNRYGKRERTSLRLLNIGLKKCGYNTLFKRANYIGQQYWGWRLLDLEHLMPQIIKIYRQAQEAYKTIPRKRKSNISTQGTAMRILEMVGVEICESDFKLCTTRDSRDECEDLWERTCLKANLKYKRHF
jgi:hypothetical protein